MGGWVVAAPQAVPWDRDPHTGAKHAVYRQYLTKWWPIMLRGWSGNVTYAEGFAGPGIYTHGEPGSPVIALQTLFSDKSLSPVVKTARLLFVDADPRCTSMLEQKLAEAAPLGWDFARLRTRGIDIAVERGTCEPTLEDLLESHGAWNHPILVVLDTWGGAVAASLLRRVADNPGSEVIVTVQPQYFSRFAAATDIEHGDKVFGDLSWREVTKQPPDMKNRWLLNQYRETVQKSGFQFVLDFELINAAGQALYLVFGTTHRRGLEKMKEAMWEVDNVNGTGYRDPRDPNQQVLEIEIEPATEPLGRLILQHLAQLPNNASRIIDLRRFALLQTVFKESQASQVVSSLLKSGKLVTTDAAGRVSFGTIVRLR